MVPPELLCRKHLLGEHVECHMFVGSILKNKSLKGFLAKNLVEVHNLRSRHDELADEIVRRGYNHKSPLQEFEARTEGVVDIEASLVDLAARCEDCKTRIEMKK